MPEPAGVPGPRAPIRAIVAGLMMIGAAHRAVGQPSPSAPRRTNETAGLQRPAIDYRVRVTPADTTGIDVTVRLRGTGDTLVLAMPAHAEYDEKTWRLVRQIRATSPQGPATVTRVDSSRWRVVTAGGEVTVQYRLAVPPAAQQPRGAWRNVVTSTGALFGGPYGLLYLLGAERMPVHIALDIPADWSVATALDTTSDSRQLYAASFDVVAESPILVGRLRRWNFIAGKTPHHVVYWPLANAAPFDTARLVESIRRIAEQAVALFGRAPHRDYTFLIQDGAFGALEHPDCVTLGITSAGLAAGDWRGAI